ncbi:MAG: hypothetical protein HC869_26185 [Rhodospirillales bacterium]|nr:hypothetical protein [Rhodospirillales bacterium]
MSCTFGLVGDDLGVPAHQLVAQRLVAKRLLALLGRGPGSHGGDAALGPDVGASLDRRFIDHADQLTVAGQHANSW